jgi:two-component system response regulator ArlR
MYKTKSESLLRELSFVSCIIFFDCHHYYVGKNILLIEDDEKISKLVKELLEEDSYHVTQSFDGDDGYSKIIEKKYDLILLDIMLPKLNGYKVCRQVRSAGITTPILMLTAKSGEYDLEEGLDTGANDYLKKPFSSVELKARIRALLRNNNFEKNKVTSNDLTVNLDARKVTIDDKNLEVSDKEFELLFYLINSKNIVVSKTEILEDVWENYFPQEEEHNLVEVYIGYLRKKLKPYNLDKKISTVRGYGYRWDDE